jgi:hypothetical protein
MNLEIRLENARFGFELQSAQFCVAAVLTILIHPLLLNLLIIDLRCEQKGFVKRRIHILPTTLTPTLVPPFNLKAPHVKH